MKALIIVDMLKDFVDGKLANPKAQNMIPPLQRLLDHAREDGWVVVFSNDAHQPGDPELKVWGEHAMAGDPGAEVIEELTPHDGEIISDKRSYGAFERSFELPDYLDTENLTADLADGVLTVTIPKHPRARPRRIQIGGGSDAKQLKG